MQASTPPRILITTSRNPTESMRTFCKNLVYHLPNSFRMNRGKSNMDSLAERALEREATKIIIIDRWKGNIGRMKLFEIGDSGLVQEYPIIHIRNVSLPGKHKAMLPGTVRSLVIQLEGGTPAQAKRLTDDLWRFFETSPETAKRIQAENNQITMQISAQRPFIQISLVKGKQRPETGLRLDVSHLTWRDEK